MKIKTIYLRFKDIVKKFPECPAIVEDNRTISYSQLDAMVNSILAKFHEKKPDFVGIVMHQNAGTPPHTSWKNRHEGPPESA